jgi:hypothetical protein
MALEMEEDFAKLIALLESFGIEILRPDLPDPSFVDGRYPMPPVSPRDYMVMIGQIFYHGLQSRFDFLEFYNNVKDHSWPKCGDLQQFKQLPEIIKDECIHHHRMYDHMNLNHCYSKIFDLINLQGNILKYNDQLRVINGAMVTRLGQDLFFGTPSLDSDQSQQKNFLDAEFPNNKNHIVNTGGHIDGTLCPVCPGLIFAIEDVKDVEKHFPGWEIVRLPGKSWANIEPLLNLKQKNKGRWWIPGFETSNDMIDTVETWLSHWTGHVEETIFDVNMLIIDTKNVIVSNYNKQVFDALYRHGVTPHIVPFRSKYFWDSGIHCVTTDLHRDGKDHLST